MNREDKIKRIYEVIADKTKEYYYKCPRCWGKLSLEGYSSCGRGEWDYDRWTCKKCWELTYEEDEKVYKNEEVVYKQLPIMIWDVLDWIWWWTYISECKNNYWYYEIDKRAIVDITNLYTYKRNPIEDQSDECIDFIYWLIENDK